MSRSKLAKGIFEALTKELAASTWAEGTALPTTRELMRRYGVSLGPLQAALHRAARYRLIEVRQRQPMVVLPGAVERASNLAEKRSARASKRRLAILIPEANFPLAENAYWARVARSVIDEAAGHGIIATILKWPHVSQVHFAQQLPIRGYAAALALGLTGRELVSLHEMARIRFPVLLHNRRLPELQLPAVVRDDYGAARRVAEMMIQRGHRRLCMISWPPMWDDLGEHGRINGWRDTLHEHGLLESSSPPVVILTAPHCTFTADVGHVLRARGGATGIVFASGSLATAVFRQEPFSKIRIPDDVSVATFDRPHGLRPTAWRAPLTTMIPNFKRMAECAVELVEKMLAGDLYPPTVRFPVEINGTESIGPVPADVTPSDREAR